MRTQHLIPMAMALALTASAAEAQSSAPLTPPRSGNGTFDRNFGAGGVFSPNPTFNNGFNQGLNNGFGNGFAPNSQFNNGFNQGFNNGFGNGFAPNSQFNSGFNGFGFGVNNGFNQGFGFNNSGFGFNGGVGVNGSVPGAPGVSPYGGAFGPNFTQFGGAAPFRDPNSPLAVSGNGYFEPGFGGGYYGGYYGPGSGYAYSTPGAGYFNNWNGGRGGVGGGFGGGHSALGVPVLGINTRPAMSRGMATGQAPRTRRVARNTVPRETSTTGTSVSPAANINRDEARLVAQVRDIMAERPMRSGEVTKIGATGVSVRYRMGENWEEDRFPVDQVFFFRDSGNLSTVAMTPGVVEIGDTVMIPDPNASAPRIQQSVAGSRQEMRGTSDRAGTATGSTVTNSSKARTSTKRTIKRSTTRRR